MDVKPEEIKRQAIAYKNYFEEYVELFRKACIFHKTGTDFPVYKSDDKLYEEFTEGKPVSL